MTREEKEQTGKYVLQMARLLEDGCYQQEMLLKAVRVIDEALEQESILDKIRAEIGQISSRYSISRERGGMGQVEWSDRLIKESEIMQILDKYKAGSERVELWIEKNM